MNILNKIINYKKKEVAEKAQLYPIPLLEKSLFFETPCLSLRHYLTEKNKLGIIAEIKRKAPSSGTLQSRVDIQKTSIGYMQAGAAALSILTDKHFFGGGRKDLMTARKFNFCPILRKDFILEEYQVVETKSFGADVCLLIADALTPEKCQSLAALAQDLGLEVLLEVRTKEQVNNYLNDHIDLVGINNRDLNDFSVEIHRSLEVGASVPPGMIKVSESGITEAAQIQQLKAAGFHGFLIGSHFMKQLDPVLACRNLVDELEVNLVCS